MDILTLVLIVGGALVLLLLVIGLIVSITSDRSMVEDRLKHYLEEEKN